MKKSLSTRNLVVAAMCLALSMVLPFLTGQVPTYGRYLSPMHIPAFLCGFLCGWPYALVVGLMAPPLRFALFQMPPIFPTGVAMMFELAAYGVISALLMRALPKKPGYIYVALLVSMLGGRVVWGVVRFILLGVSNVDFSWKIFMTSAFVETLPGAILHFVAVPPIVLALKRREYRAQKTSAA